VDDNIVKFEPFIKEIGLLKIEIDKITKNFRPGDNVTVIRGMHSGESGIVTKNENNKAFVFSDFSNKEIQVLSNDLKLSKETGNMIIATSGSSGGSSSLNLKVFDVVSYNNNKNIGMII
jgi:transcription elongation factor SPT5